MAIAAVLAGGAGYSIGVHYPRRASYTVTAGDIEATSTAGLVGALAGGAFVAGLDRPSPAQYAGFLGGGYLAGLALGDLSIARRFDLTQAQANVMNVGAVAGALLGLAVPVLMDGEDNATPYAVAAGGAVSGNDGDREHLSARRRRGSRPRAERSSGELAGAVLACRSRRAAWPVSSPERQAVTFLLDSSSDLSQS